MNDIIQQLVAERKARPANLSAASATYAYIGDEHAGRTIEVETQPKRYADEWPDE